MSDYLHPQRRINIYTATVEDLRAYIIEWELEFIEQQKTFFKAMSDSDRLREAAEAALPLLRGQSCWHDDPEEPDCCEHAFVAEQLSVALGNDPHPLYWETLAALGKDGKG